MGSESFYSGEGKVRVGMRSPLGWLAVLLVLEGSAGCGGGSSGTVPPPVRSPASITKVFGANSIALNANTTLTFNLTNPNSSKSLSSVGFTDAFPAGLVVSTPSGLTGSCGSGVITANAGAATVSLSGATLAALGSCNFAVNVTGTTAGTLNNVTSAVTSAEGGNGHTATANLTVAAAGQKPAEITDISPIN